MSTRELTCVVCPAGCKIMVTLDEHGNVVEVEGNTCARGKKYAESEVTNPVRTLTSTVKLETSAGLRLLPVRTDKPIPRASLFEAMDMVRNITLKSPVRTGDIIVPDFVEPGTNLIACKDFE